MIGKPTFWAQANFEKTQLKIIIFSNKFFSPDLDKATIKPSYYESSYHKFLFLGDMDDYIRPIKGRFPRSGHEPCVLMSN